MLGPADGVVNEIELDLEFLALRDFGAIGVQQRLRVGDFLRHRFRVCSRSAGRSCHLGANGAQLVHDLAVQGTGIAGVRRQQACLREVLLRYESACDEPAWEFPKLQPPGFKRNRFNFGFTPELVRTREEMDAHQRLTMRPRVHRK